MNGLIGGSKMLPIRYRQYAFFGIFGHVQIIALKEQYWKMYDERKEWQVKY